MSSSLFQDGSPQLAPNTTPEKYIHFFMIKHHWKTEHSQKLQRLRKCGMDKCPGRIQWPWPWRKLLTLHTKQRVHWGSVVQKVWDGQMFAEYLKLYCNLHLQDSNLHTLQVHLSTNNAPAYQVWLQKVEQFRRYKMKMFSFLIFKLWLNYKVNMFSFLTHMKSKSLCDDQCSYVSKTLTLWFSQKL